jgi:hypothetical protein
LRLALRVFALSLAACSPAARSGTAPSPAPAELPVPAPARRDRVVPSTAEIFVAPVDETGLSLDLTAWPSDPPPEIALRACGVHAADEAGWLLVRVSDRAQVIEASVIDSAGLARHTVDCIRRTLETTPLVPNRAVASVLLYVALR